MEVKIDSLLMSRNLGGRSESRSLQNELPGSFKDSKVVRALFVRYWVAMLEAPPKQQKLWFKKLAEILYVRRDL